MMASRDRRDVCRATMVALVCSVLRVAGPGGRARAAVPARRNDHGGAGSHPLLRRRLRPRQQRLPCRVRRGTPLRALRGRRRGGARQRRADPRRVGGHLRAARDLQRRPRWVPRDVARLPWQPEGEHPHPRPVREVRHDRWAGRARLGRLLHRGRDRWSGRRNGSGDGVFDGEQGVPGRVEAVPGWLAERVRAAGRARRVAPGRRTAADVRCPLPGRPRGRLRPHQQLLPRGLAELHRAQGAWRRAGTARGCGQRNGVSDRPDLHGHGWLHPRRDLLPGQREVLRHLLLEPGALRRVHRRERECRRCWPGSHRERIGVVQRLERGVQPGVELVLLGVPRDESRGLRCRDQHVGGPRDDHHGHRHGRQRGQLQPARCRAHEGGRVDARGADL